MANIDQNHAILTHHEVVILQITGDIYVSLSTVGIANKRVTRASTYSHTAHLVTHLGDVAMAHCIELKYLSQTAHKLYCILGSWQLANNTEAHIGIARLRLENTYILNTNHRAHTPAHAVMRAIEICVRSIERNTSAYSSLNTSLNIVR